MTDPKTLEEKIKLLEERISRIENKLAADSGEDEYMGALYQKAKELVIKHHKSTAIFLQKKLFIDYPRAAKLLSELKTNGIIK